MYVDVTISPFLAVHATRNMNSLHLRGKSSRVICQARWYYYMCPRVPLRNYMYVHVVSRTLYLSGLQVRISAKAAGNTTSATESLLWSYYSTSQWQHTNVDIPTAMGTSTSVAEILTAIILFLDSMIVSFAC
jgi:hypothetical protein